MDDIRSVKPRDPLDVCFFILFSPRLNFDVTCSALLPCPGDLQLWKW